ncbi:MAG: hypothetical protein PHU29_06205 [Sulfuricurvum sp.]|uniref:hypothetical protein n=1 Tax=Sulfuricurvum sp. TaxID=2025608 RepID=UPI002604110A|nr:hypothetical protein [Sulfuricurvum sp.]MDD2950365.1 hypothetical protein [Sulfuricurvum sp.]MDD5117977.1 hypothetical protein [Sulfuricurvum sp.]
MSKSKQQTYSTIVSANPYRGDYFSSTYDTISETTSPSFKKEQYAVSFLNTKGFITTLIGISKNIPDDDIYDALENKVYEELALDMAVEYHIKYIEAIHRSSEGDRFFHVFVVDPLTLEQDYTQVVNSIKYIDQIVPVPLLIKSLYVKEIIDSSDVHCFIYFQENDAFFCIYNEQEFVYAKSLKFSLKQMHERFCELLGEQIDLNSFERIIANEGLNTSSPDYQKNFIKLFGEIFLHISDVMTYAKRAYEIKKFDEIFIGTGAGSVTGLDEYAQTYLGLKTTPFDFNYGFNTNGVKVDQIHQLMHLYGRLESDERYDCNFTIYHRPPPFAKRDSGRLILVIAASLAAALLYPGVYWGLSYAEEFHHAVLTKEYETVHKDKTEREAIINLKIANKNAAQALLDEQRNAYKQKQDTLVQVHEKKVNYPMKSKIMSDFTRSFNQYRVQLKNVSYEENNNSKTFTFGLTSSNTQDITALLKHLTDIKRDKYDFNLELISYNEEEKSYLSELKAVIK